MFCSSLRKRPTWAHIVPVLGNDKTVAWKGTRDQGPLRWYGGGRRESGLTVR